VAAPASVFDKRRALHKRKFNEGVPDRQKMTMFDLIYYNPEGNRMSNSSSRRTSRASASSEDLKEPESQPDPEPEGELKTPPRPVEEDNEEDGAMPVPQVKVGPNGEMIIDEESTLIETTAAKRAKEDLLRTPLVFEGDKNGSSAGYGTWGRRRKNVDWGEKETLRFYRALACFGTDFSMMEEVFKKRSRQELKMKFKKEERQNRLLVDKCLREGTVFDPSNFHTDSEEEGERERKEAASTKKRKKKAETKPKRKRVRKVRNSRGYYSSDADESEAATSESDTKRARADPFRNDLNPLSSTEKPSSNAPDPVDVASAVIATAELADDDQPEKPVEEPKKMTTRRRAAFKPNLAASNGRSPRAGNASPLLKSLLSSSEKQKGSSSSSSSAAAFPPGLLAANPALASAEPGSLVLVASPAENDPERQMLHVYRVDEDGGQKEKEAS